MSGDIVLSSAIRSNLLALQNTSTLQSTTQNHLATGKKVNSALDNATSFFTAAAFTSRAGQLSGLLDSIGNSVQTLKAASTGIDSITKLVDNLRATARQALQAPSAYSSKASVTSSAGIAGATAADLRGTGGPANGDTLIFTVGSSPAVTFTFSNTNKSLDDLNSALSSAGLTASLDSAGKLTVTTTSQTESQTFTVGGTGATAAFGAASPAVSTPVRTGAGAAVRDGFVSQFNGLLTQIDSIAKDSNFNGVNLLKGDTLSVIFNETSTSKLDIKGTTFDAAGLGVSVITSTDFNDGNNINALIAKLDAATSSLQSQASKFGSNLSIVQTRQDFSKNLINTLQTGADNLTLADTNEEAANLLALQTRQQLSQSALSLANQAAQGVLRLF